MKQEPTTQADKLDVEQDDYLDEALVETFPASDAISPGRTEARPHQTQEAMPVQKPAATPAGNS